MPELPSGTVTFLFTDIEGSTRLVQKLGGEFPRLLEQHRDLLTSAISEFGGIVTGTEGDSFFAVFKSAEAALLAVVQAQRALLSATWPQGVQLKVRMGLHTGEGVLGGQNYAGIDVHRAARISAAGHGGQVLISSATYGLLEGKLGPGIAVKDLGEHRLKDLDKAEHVFQLVISGLPADFPAIRSLLSRPNNLPAQLTSFVGRKTEVAQIKRLMQSTRLLTLTGPGGTGKTRLSLQAAAELLDSFSDGVFFVPLAPISDPSLILPTIAETLGLKETGSISITDLLKEYLAGKELLLVLDNFEQVISGAVEVADLLEAAPALKALVSSRETLHVSGEQEFPVPPLGLPDSRHLPPLEKLTQYEAVALLIQRGSAVRPGFQVTSDNAPAVAEICARLDGLPLAIELAAARLKILSPQAILSRLESRLGLLTGGRSDLPARQQTLRNAIDWSYDLLDPSEKRLFRRLGVFRGGWTLEASEAVCVTEAGGGIAMVDALSSLVDKSLVRQDEQTFEEPRFGMLETIREFALEALGKEDDPLQIKSRHAGYFLELVEKAAPDLTRDREKVRQLAAEHDNIRAVLSFALEKGDAGTGLRLGGVSWRFWQLQGHFREARRWLSELLALPSAQQRDLPRAKGLSALGSIAYWQNDIDVATACYEESLSIFRELSDREGIAEQLYNLGYAAAASQDHPRARKTLSEAAGLYKEMGNRLAVAYAEYALSLVASLEGNEDEEMRLASRTAEIFEQMNEKYGLAMAVGSLAHAQFASGDLKGAWENGKKSMLLFNELGDLSGVAYGIEAMAELALTSRDHHRAVVLAGAASAVKEKIGGGAPGALAVFPDFKAEAEKVMSPLDVEQAWAEGLSLSAEEAVAYALKESS